MNAPHASIEMIRAIQAVAEFGSRSKAAGQLGITVSALDKRLRNLSTLMGTQLVSCSGDSVELLEPARIYTRDALRALEFAVLAEERTKAHLLLAERKLICGHSTYLSPRMLKMIHDIQFDPDDQVSVEHRTGLTAVLASRVSGGSLHVGFGFMPILDPEIRSTVLSEEAIMVCMPSAHRLASRTSARPEDLDGEAVIAVAREPQPALHQEVADYFEQFGVDLTVAGDAFSPSEALILVEQQKGICFLAGSSITKLKGVVSKPLTTKGLTRKSGVFIRSDQDHPLVLRFVDEAIRLSGEVARERLK